MSNVICPECQQGKHDNCSAMALDPETDVFVDCACKNEGHPILTHNADPAKPVDKWPHRYNCNAGDCSFNLKSKDDGIVERLSDVHERLEHYSGCTFEYHIRGETNNQWCATHKEWKDLSESSFAPEPAHIRKIEADIYG